MPTVTLARLAMATRFEIVLHGEHPAELRAAGEEALDEIQRLELRLSLFRPESEIAHLNSRAARGPIRVSPELFALLQRAQRLSSETAGAFDITVAPLLRCWGLLERGGRIPGASELAAARATVGMHLVHLDAAESTVKFERDGVMLDLGAIGKGYAVERAAGVLREAGVTSALVHGGTSTIHALGSPPGASRWLVALEPPENAVNFRLSPALSSTRLDQTKLTNRTKVGQDLHGLDIPPGRTVAIPLRDESLSVSAVWGKFFEAEGRLFGHVLDPRTGSPADSDAVLAAVVLPSATESDALSTALLVLGPEGHDTIWRLRQGMRTWLLRASASDAELETRGAAASAL